MGAGPGGGSSRKPGHTGSRALGWTSHTRSGTDREGASGSHTRATTPQLPKVTSASWPRPRPWPPGGDRGPEPPRPVSSHHARRHLPPGRSTEPSPPVTAQRAGARGGGAAGWAQPGSPSHGFGQHRLEGPDGDHSVRHTLRGSTFARRQPRPRRRRLGPSADQPSGQPPHSSGPAQSTASGNSRPAAPDAGRGLCGRGRAARHQLRGSGLFITAARADRPAGRRDRPGRRGHRVPSVESFGLDPGL